MSALMRIWNTYAEVSFDHELMFPSSRETREAELT
jgi:hypothetical protein